MFDLKCDNCNEIFHIDEQHLGKHFCCTKCGTLITIVKPQVSIPEKEIKNDATKPNTSNRLIHKLWGNSTFKYSVIGIIILSIILLVIYTANTNKLNEPIKPVESDYSLANGTVVYPSLDYSGHGELIVENGTNTDAVIKLVSGNYLYRAVYILKNSNCTLQGIPPGNYNVYFCLGLNWDVNNECFTHDCSYTKFDEPFVFDETSDGYRIYTITLQPVIDGNAQTETISKDEFGQFSGPNQ